MKMKLNAGIVTDNLQVCKNFYTGILNFVVSFENEFYLLLHTPGKVSEISFLIAHHPSQQAAFKEPYNGKGVYLTIEVDDVDKVYKYIKDKDVEIKLELRDEPWGGRHFVIEDPNGVAIDIVAYSASE